MARSAITQRNPLHYRSMSKDQVKQGVKFRILSAKGRIIEQGEFNSAPEGKSGREMVHVILDTGQMTMRFLDDMGIIPRPNLLWRKDRFTLRIK